MNRLFALINVRGNDAAAFLQGQLTQDLDGLVLSGGAPRVGLQHTLGACADHLDKLPYPILGICAGEQFMAAFAPEQIVPALEVAR